MDYTKFVDVDGKQILPGDTVSVINYFSGGAEWGKYKFKRNVPKNSIMVVEKLIYIENLAKHRHKDINVYSLSGSINDHPDNQPNKVIPSCRVRIIKRTKYKTLIKGVSNG